MTEDKTTITDNEVIALIAEFMGLRWRKIYGPLTGAEYIEVYDTLSLKYLIAKYSTSWECLMPVLEKIESLGEITLIHNKKCVMFNTNITVIADSKIEATYQAVVNWIRGYNSTTQNKEQS